ncbi:MAG: hypothetical protein AB8B40_05545 [Prochlorococcus sp.]|mgnify:FL=1
MRSISYAALFSRQLIWPYLQAESIRNALPQLRLLLIAVAGNA